MSVNLRIGSIYLAALLHLISGIAQAQTPAEASRSFNGITVYADSRLIDKNFGASIRVDLGQLSLRDLQSVSVTSGNSEILPETGKPVAVTLAVPRGAAASEVTAFKNAVTPALQQRFASSQLNVKLLEIDVPEAELAAAASNADIDEVAKRLEPAQRQAGSEIAEALKGANITTVQTLRGWRTSFSEQVRELRYNPEARALAVAGLIGAGTSVAPITVFLSTTGMNSFGFAQCLLTVLMDQANSTFSTRLVRWEMEHRFPFFKESRIVKFYNGSALVRAAVFNFSMNAVFGFALRSYSYMHRPYEVASPMSMEFLRDLGGLNIASSVFSAGADVGVRQLRAKGYISPRTEIVINATFNLLAQMNNAMLGLGLANFLPFGVAIEWSAKSLAFATGSLLPARADRVVVLHPTLKSETSQNAVKYLTGVETMIKSGVSPEQIRELAKNVDVDGNVIEKQNRARDMFRQRYNASLQFIQRAWYKTCGFLREALKTPPLQNIIL